MATGGCRAPGYGTEYSDNFSGTPGLASTNARTKASFPTSSPQPSSPRQQSSVRVGTINPGFPSTQYPGRLRETVVHKDERGHYINPFANLVSKPSGRRLVYDHSHPDKMYTSLWSSELADHTGPYSFPLPTAMPPELPFNRDMAWQADCEVARWPTERWKHWRSVAACPTYDGHDDQVEYSKYKVRVP